MVSAYSCFAARTPWFCLAVLVSSPIPSRYLSSESLINTGISYCPEAYKDVDNPQRYVQCGSMEHFGRINSSSRTQCPLCVPSRCPLCMVGGSQKCVVYYIPDISLTNVKSTAMYPLTETNSRPHEHAEWTMSFLLQYEFPKMLASGDKFNISQHCCSRRLLPHHLFHPARWWDEWLVIGRLTCSLVLYLFSYLF
jgi:hypothetical protein